MMLLKLVRFISKNNSKYIELFFFDIFFILNLVLYIIGGVNINKKYFPIISSIIVGIILGNIIFNSYSNTEYMSSNYNVYYLQYGTYINMEVLNNNIKKLNDYVIVNENDKYYVYLGVFTNYDNALKVSEILEDNKIYTFIKNDYIENNELVNKIGEIDQKLLLTNNINEINKLVKETLNIYKK